LSAYLIRRAIRSVIVILGVLVITFTVMRLSGDPVSLFVAETASEDEIKSIRKELGLDKPIYIQFAYYVKRAAVGDFGRSFRMNQPAGDLVAARLPVTFKLAVAAIGLAAVIAIPLGILSAFYRGTFIDNLAMGGAVMGQSIPTFWLGMMLVIFFAVSWKIFPTSGSFGIRSLILPAITLAGYPVASITRLMRSGMLEVLSQDYIRTARAKGLHERRVLFRHALKNAAVSVVTLLGVQFSTLMGGAIITEQVFVWPGLGLLLVQSIFTRDYAVVQAAVIVFATVVVIMNLFIDFIYTLLDPRITMR
jgi:peptide/nickel transport system permease protein